MSHPARPLEHARPQAGLFRLDGPSTPRLVLAPPILVLLAIVASGVAMSWSGADTGRRLLVMHSTLSTLVLPLALAAVLVAANGPMRVGLAVGAATVGSVFLLAGLALFTGGKSLLTTWLPTIADPAFIVVQVAVAAAGLALLVGISLPGRMRTDDARALAWTALPLGVTQVSLAWGWTASDAHAGHVRAELATWAAGHAAPFVVSSLLVAAWTGLAEFDVRQRHRWCVAAALPAIGILVQQASVAVDDARALRIAPEILRWGIWPVPLLLAATLLRDDIRRSVAGMPFYASLACFAMAAAAGYIAGVEPLATTGLAIRAHALPAALAVATLSLALRLRPWPHRPAATPERRFATAGALAAVTLLGTLIALGASPAARPPLPERLPQGESPRQHVDAKRAEEIATRFAQGVEMMRVRQFDFAAKAFHRVLELDPTMPEAHVNMGFALLETGDLASAQRFFESATRLKRDQLNAYYGLALAAHAQKNHEVAVGAMRTWLHLAPTDDPFRAKAQAKYDEMQQAFLAQRRERGDALVAPARPS
jgi:tetratricopeptide (TPR) repeat protein